MKIRILLVDSGSYHHEEVTVPSDGLEEYDRLIDFLREDEVVQKALFIDVDRLCSAWIVE